MTSTDTNKISDIDSNLKNLYEKDYYKWIHATINLLKEGKLEQLDRENLIEEIGDIGIREKEELDNNLRILITELLKYKYYSKDLSGMELSKISTYQRNIIRTLEDSPSLMEYLEEIFEENYQLAREYAAVETDSPLETFPIKSQFSAKKILQRNRKGHEILKIIEDMFIN